MYNSQQCVIRLRKLTKQLANELNDDLFLIKNREALPGSIENETISELLHQVQSKAILATLEDH